MSEEVVLTAAEVPPVSIQDVIAHPETSLTDDAADAIVRQEAAKMQRQAAGIAESVDTNTGTPEGMKRGLDGKFAKADVVSEEDKAAADKAAADKAAADKAKKEVGKTEVEKSADAIAAKASSDASAKEAARSKAAATRIPAFDVDAVVTSAIEEVGKRKYQSELDAEGKPVMEDGKKLMEDYGQIIEPVRDMVKEIAKQLKANFDAEVSKIRSQIEEPIETAKVDKMVQAVTELVPDFPSLNMDPRFSEFMDKHPQYEGLISTDPARAADMAWLCDKFMESVGITKSEPVGKPAKPATSTPSPRSRSVQAAIASGRGGSFGAETGELTAVEVSKMSEDAQQDFVREQARIMQSRESERRRMLGE